MYYKFVVLIPDFIGIILNITVRLIHRFCIIQTGYVNEILVKKNPQLHYYRPKLMKQNKSLVLAWDLISELPADKSHERLVRQRRRSDCYVCYRKLDKRSEITFSQ